MLKLAMTTSLAVVATVAALGGMNLYTYHRFTHEAEVATIAFERIADQHFNAQFTPVDGVHQTYELKGDEWQLDVRMVKWSDWLTFLGEDPLYRLDRLSGRFINIDDMRTMSSFTAHSLNEDLLVDVWDFARTQNEWLPGVDAAYGSGVFLPMADGKRYQISITRSGLIARPELEEAE